MIRGDPMINSNIETCQQRRKQMYESLDIGNPVDRNRTVAAVSTRGRQPPRRGPATVARGQRMSSGILHYSREEYAKLTPEQTEQSNDCIAAKAAKAARRLATARTVGAVTSTSTVSAVNTMPSATVVPAVAGFELQRRPGIASPPLIRPPPTPAQVSATL
jgi:hypothetical protein